MNNSVKTFAKLLLCSPRLTFTNYSLPWLITLRVSWNRSRAQNFNEMQWTSMEAAHRMQKKRSCLYNLIDSMTVWPAWTFMHLLPPNLTWRIMMAQNRAVTTYRLPLQTVGTGRHSNINFNLDTTSTLTITTLALHKDIHLYQEP